MSPLRNLAFACCLGFAALGLGACEEANEGPAERAGEAVDGAAERAGQAVENAGERIQNETQQ